MAGQLRPGDEAPNFELRDADGEVHRLSELRGRKVILYFYPADDTPGCTAEACDFRDTLDVWEKAGYVVLGVSPQGAESKKSFREKYSLTFPLLIDEDLSVHEAYGVRQDEGMTWGDIPLITRRSTFVIDEDGTIVQAMYGVNPRGHVEDLRAKLDA